MSDTLPQGIGSSSETDQIEKVKSISNQNLISYIDQFWFLLQETYDATLEGARPVKPEDALNSANKIRELATKFDFNMSLIEDRNLKGVMTNPTA